jgi:hypothetical protein
MNKVVVRDTEQSRFHTQRVVKKELLKWKVGDGRYNTFRYVLHPKNDSSLLIGWCTRVILKGK